MAKDSEGLLSIVQEVYAELDRQSPVDISSHICAAEAMKIIDPKGIGPAMEQLGCTLYLRQLARGVCHERAEDGTGGEFISDGQGTLFDGQLQRRYPIGDGKTYRLREHMTYAERMANAERLESESVAKAKHARALRAETEMLVAQGKLSIHIAA